MNNEQIINQLEHIKKLIEEEEFDQQGQHDDSGFYESGTFVESKIVETEITKLIHDILNV